MKPAPIPADDAARVADLRALNVLDTPREQRFDRITDLAADVFGVKMCFINLVDADRQWFSPASARMRSSSPTAWSCPMRPRIQGLPTTRS